MTRSRTKSGRHIFLLVGVAACSLLLSGFGGAQRTKAAPGSAKTDARRALVDAGKLARLPRGTKVADRGPMLEKALAAYAAVEARFGAMPEVAAEALFRQGQLLGRLGRTQDAVAAFRNAARKSAKSFGARALCEAGHVLRRAKLYTDALTTYRAAGALDDAKYADRAKLWVGKTLVKLGRLPDARKTFEALAASRGVDVYERIQAFDALARSYLDEKRLADARLVLADARDSLSAEAAGEGKGPERVRRRIERMPARRRLAKIEAKARAAAGDGRR